MSGRLRQKKFHEFKASLSYIVSLRSALTGRFNGGKREGLYISIMMVNMPRITHLIADFLVVFIWVGSVIYYG